jgi:hypothetical protein
LVRESGATPIWCTYLHFEKMTPESTLEDIWYRSRGLHLIGAPIYIFKNLEGLDQSDLALNQSQIALTNYSMSDGALGNFTTRRKIRLTRIKDHLPSTRGLLTGSGTLGTTSPRLGQEEHGGGVPRIGPLGLRARARRPITDAI